MPKSRSYVILYIIEFHLTGGSYVIIYDRIAKDYLNGLDIGVHRDEWYFTKTETSRFNEGEFFTLPRADAGQLEKAWMVYNAISSVACNFNPLNRRVWNLLFPVWQSLLKNTGVALIVGYPEPYDATVELDEQGDCHVIFDLICWTKYVGNCDIEATARNLLTHEFTHVLLHHYRPELTEITDDTDYLSHLDAISFDEGFAHLLSYDSKEIDAVDWRSEKLMNVYEQCRKKLGDAIAEKEPSKQNCLLYEALCGNYYEKYACMCGMLYLANLWIKGGDMALKEAMDSGCDGFANKAIGK